MRRVAGKLAKARHKMAATHLCSFSKLGNREIVSKIGLEAVNCTGECQEALPSHARCGVADRGPYQGTMTASAWANESK